MQEIVDGYRADQLNLLAQNQLEQLVRNCGVEDEHKLEWLLHSLVMSSRQRQLPPCCYIVRCCPRAPSRTCDLADYFACRDQPFSVRELRDLYEHSQRGNEADRDCELSSPDQMNLVV